MRGSNEMSTKKSRHDNYFAFCENCESICCKGARPPLIQKRINAINKFLLTKKIEIKQPFERTMYFFPREVDGEYCVFFNRDKKKCIIHPIKPETCAAGPITFDINLDTGNIEYYLKSKNICRLAGALYLNKKELQDHLLYAKSKIISLIKDLPKEDLFTILSIEEPETFKIGEDKLDPEIQKLICLESQNRSIKVSIPMQTKRSRKSPLGLSKPQSYIPRYLPRFPVS